MKSSIALKLQFIKCNLGFLDALHHLFQFQSQTVFGRDSMYLSIPIRWQKIIRSVKSLQSRAQKYMSRFETEISSW